MGCMGCMAAACEVSVVWGAQRIAYLPKHANERAVDTIHDEPCGVGCGVVGWCRGGRALELVGQRGGAVVSCGRPWYRMSAESGVTISTPSSMMITPRVCSDTTMMRH